MAVALKDTVLFYGKGSSTDWRGLLSGETDGLAIDFSDTTYFNTQTWSQSWNQKRAASVDTLTSPHTFYTNGGTSAKIVNIDPTTLGWSPHNIALQSEDFATTWGNVRSTDSSNVTTAPDGTVTADKLIEDATATNSHLISQTISFTAGFTYTFSCYLKAAERTWAQLVFSGAAFNANSKGNFDLTNGVVGTLGPGALSQGIQSVGSGWYRCWFKALCISTTTTVAGVFLSTGDAGEIYNGDNASGIYVWGAQVSQGPNLSSYIKTVAAAVYGLPISYGEGLLVEPAATNLLLRSQEIDNASWTKTACTVAADQITAPDGTLTADAITTTSTGDKPNQSVTCVTLTDYTVSYFLKAGAGTQWMNIELSDAASTNGLRAWFDIVNGVAGAAQAGFGSGWTGKGFGITNIGNGWYRCWSTVNTTGTALKCGLRSATADASAAGINGVVYYDWGTQAELGTVATSYIPTVASTVTRAADAPNVATSAYPHSATDGTFVVWGKVRIIDYTISPPRWWTLNDTTNNELVALDQVAPGTPDSFEVQIRDGNVQQGALGSGTVSASGNKVAGFYKLNDFGIVADGGSEVVDTSGTMPTVTNLQLGYRSDVAGKELNGWIQRFIYVPRRMTQAEMQAATTDGTLLSGETDGLAIDFNNTSRFNMDPWLQDWNQKRASSVDTFSSPHTFYTNGGTSAKILKTSATGVGWSPHNLFLQSETFDNASWTKTNATITPNAAYTPDGKFTADKFVEANASVIQRLQQYTPVVGLTYNLSVYAKSAGNSRYLEFGGGGLATPSECPNFNIDAGTVSLGGTSTICKSATITDVGNGWYRCSAVIIPTVAALFAMNLSDSSSDHAGSSYTGNGTSGLYIWGAQVSRGANLSSYIKTVAAAVYGLPISYGEGLLVEPAATNLCLRSEELDNASWTKAATSVTANATTAPDGTLTADKLVEDTGSTGKNVKSANVTITASTTYTASIYVKTAGRPIFEFNFLDGGSTVGIYTDFDLTKGTINTAGAGAFGTGGVKSGESITYVGDGWYRCSVTGILGTAVTGRHHLVEQVVPGANYTGDGVSGLYFWGAQIELGSVPTSYIPTVASTVTRAADAVNVATTAYPHSDTNGTFITWGKFRMIDDPAARQWIVLSDGTNNEAIRIENLTSGTPDNFTIAIRDGSVDQIASGVTQSGSVNLAGNKTALFYKLNDSGLLVDGGAEVVDTSVTMPTVTNLQLGYHSAIAAREMNGFIQRLIYVPRRMLTAEMQARTV